MAWALIGVAGDRRVAGFQAALAAAGEPPAALLPWSAAIADADVVRRALRPGDALRIESPGADAAVWSALAGLGGQAQPAPPHGEWRPGRAWADGLRAALARIDAAVAALPLRRTHDAAEIAAMTDKRACRERLAAAGVPIPPGFAAPAEAAALRAELRERRWARVFVKPRWGSSGAGVLAFARRGHADDAEESLTTTVLLRGEAGARWINSKRLRVYRDRPRIDALLARVLEDGAVVERWIPKPSLAGGPCDLRVLAVAGEPRHRVARVGRGPLTNLHLDARRADADALLRVLPARARAELDAVCAAAARCFPRSLAVGIDCLVDDAGRARVLEVNAWGDLLPGLLHRGEDAYAAQIAALRDAAPRAACAR